MKKVKTELKVGAKNSFKERCDLREKQKMGCKKESRIMWRYRCR